MPNELFTVEYPDGEMIDDSGDGGFSVYMDRSSAEDSAEQGDELEVARYVRANKAPEDTSDGYHTFKELYEHRIELYIQLCKIYENEAFERATRHSNSSGNYKSAVWKSVNHSDGSILEGWFILGINRHAGEQITYHLPMRRWADCDFAETRDKAPQYDGHTSADVLERLKRL